MRFVVVVLALLLGSGGVQGQPKAQEVPRYRLEGLMTLAEGTKFFAWLVKHGDAPEIEVEIDSPGGDTRVARAMTIGMAGRKTRCVVRKRAFSAAFYLLQQCNLRLADRGAQLMTHEPSFEFPVGATLNRYQLQLYLGILSERAAQWNHELAARLKMPLAAYELQVANRDWWMTPDEALAAGAIDRVVD